MDLDRRSRIEALFEAALDQPAEDRSEWLETECAGDPALLSEVQAMLAWAVHLAPSFGARALGAVRRSLPSAMRRHPRVRRTVAAAARRMLRIDNLAVAGRTPSGHRFELDAHRFWVVDASSAREHGAHLGPPVILRTPVRLGDFSIPAWGIFTMGDAVFEP